MRRGSGGVCAAEPLDRGTWLRQEVAGTAHERFVRELAVREDDGRAIVSFLLDQVRGRATETWFVVDIWKGDRILSRLATRAVGATPPTRRPSGKE